MAAETDTTGRSLRVGQPKKLFTLTAPGFQPASDGRRILVFEPSAGAAERPMVVVQNWAAGLGK